jgi:hypothetical protein
VFVGHDRHFVGECCHSSRACGLVLRVPLI